MSESEPVRHRGLRGSVRHALDGLLHCVVRQRNMKVHVVSALLVGLVGSGIRLGLTEKVTLLFCVLLVFFAEILNTALETLVDLHTERFHERARVVKDTSAAGVLVLSLGTVVIFAAILATNWRTVAESWQAVLRQAAAGAPLAALAAALLAEWRRPAAADWAIAAAGAGLLALLATWTTSAVFTALTAGLFGLCVEAALRRRRDASQTH